MFIDGNVGMSFGYTQLIGKTDYLTLSNLLYEYNVGWLI